jgi:hypothetical protein
MMEIRRIFVFVSIIACLGLASCENGYDTVFDKSPDERVSERLKEYQAFLKEAPYGWNGVLETGTGKQFYYYFKFNDNGSVTMVSDFNTETFTAMTGTWKLKALQQPTLSFDTYSYIHLPADPKGDTNGGNNGEGLISDFEFALPEYNGTNWLLRGIQRGSKITLQEATQQQADFVLNGGMEEMYTYLSANKGLRLVLPDSEIATVAFDLKGREVVAQYVSNDNQRVSLSAVYFRISHTGIEFNEPLSVRGNNISRFNWDPSSKEYSATVAGSNTTIYNSTALHIFEPNVTLKSVLGFWYEGIIVPANSIFDPIPGQSQEFLGKYKTAIDNLYESAYKLRLLDSYFIFDLDNYKMYVVMDVYQPSSGQRYYAVYRYGYTFDSSNFFKFTYEAPNDVGEVVLDLVKDVLDPIKTEKFKADYVGGGLNLTGGFFSQDSGFAFSGYLY